MPRDCRAMVVWIWGIPGVCRGRGIGSVFLMGRLAGPCRKFPTARGLGRRVRRGPALAPASARRRGARCPGVTPRRKGGPRAAPTGPGAGATQAGVEGGLGSQLGQKRPVWGSRARAKGKAWGCLGVPADRKGGKVDIGLGGG